MIPLFMLNLLLAGVYVALVGGVTFLDVLVGFGVGLAVVSLTARAAGRPGYARGLWGLVCFAVYFLKILVTANLQVAREIITPGFGMKPRILRYPVDGLTPAEVTTLANAITLTPGTLSADIDDDGRLLYIHCMYAEDRDAALAEIDALRCHLMREVFNHDA